MIINKKWKNMMNLIIENKKLNYYKYKRKIILYN